VVIVDAHQHLWDPATRDYAWMTGDQATLRRPFTSDELEAEAARLGVTATVAVQAATAEDETVALLAVADDRRTIVAGVVGWVDLRAPDVADRIAALRERPGGERLVGIRHPVHDEADVEWLLRPEVLAGLRAVAAAGLSYDLLLRPAHLAVATDLALRMPELRLVLDHGAKPEIATRGWEPWSSELAALAAHENVHCKLSGLVTEADWRTWRPEDVRPYADRLLDLFGPGRLMFGSDWPVCTLAASYGDVLELGLQTTASLSEGERDAVMAGTAVAVYGLAGLVGTEASAS
jgi:L-fucono-1,5-lactonase